jgi:hypothetical protein
MYNPAPFCTEVARAGGAGIRHVSKGAYGVLAVVLVILWMLGIGYLLAGFIAGTLVVVALMMTVEKIIPGFWHIATNPLGKIAVLAGTGWLTHYVFGASTIVGMIALCWSLVFKVIVIEQKAREMGKAHA